MRFSACLFIAAFVLAVSTLTAHADTYEFIVSNFDGYGSSATFELPSSISNIYQYQGDLFTTGAVVNFVFEPGTTVSAYVDGPTYYTGSFYNTTNTVYASRQMLIGFTDRGGFDFAVGPFVTVDEPEYRFYTLLTVFLGETPTLFTVEDDTATFKLGTFTSSLNNGFTSTQDASVTIVDATPEPSTFVLFGTGIFGLVGVARHKFAK